MIPPDTSSLVVTADDLGLSSAVTKGILHAHTGGVVRSTSLLVTYDSGEEGAALAREHSGLEVGLHLDLIGGRPVSDPALVRSLVDRDGRFVGLERFVRALAVGRIRAAEVALEIRAQAQRAREWGIEPLAWDSHRHSHALPLVARVVGAVAREQGVRWLRRPVPAPVWTGRKPLALRLAMLAAEPFFRGIPGNHWYVDLSSWRAESTSVAVLVVRGGIGELGAHPGYADDALRARDKLVEQRASDLETLTDPLLRRVAEDVGVAWRVS